MLTLRHAIPGGQTDPSKGHSPPPDRVLPAAPVSVPQARRFVVDTLHTWGLDDVTAASVQVVAELAANAVREGEHSEQPEILLRLSATRHYVFIQAGDHNPIPPPRAPRRVRSTAEHGRGLSIARALSRRLAWYEDAGWKIVWASVPIPNTQPQPAGRQRWGTAA